MNTEDYKNGTLSEEDLEKVTRQLVQAKFRDDQKKHWGQLLKTDFGIEREIALSKSDKRIAMRPRRILLGLAAAIALLLLLIPLKSYFTQSPAQLVDQYLGTERMMNQEADQKGLNNTSTLRLTAAELYNAGNYPAAAAVYQDITNTAEVEVADYFFAGLCQLYLDQPEAALRLFEQASTLSQTEAPFREELNWFNALAQIKRGDLAGAQLTLSTIQAGEWNFSKAQVLLKQLK